MAAAIGVVVGLVLGFVAGWLVRDASSRPLLTNREFGIGVPAEWHRRQAEQPGEGDR